MASDIPSHYRALVVPSVGADLRVEQRPIPEAIPGSVVVRVIESSILSYQREIYSNSKKRPYPFATPIVGGCSAVGRVVATGPDATIVQPGQLVWVDCVVRGRDDNEAIFLFGIHEGSTPSSQKLAGGIWHDGTFAEFARVPLENCIPINEARLCGEELAYSPRDLIYLSHLLVAFGGLRSIDVKPGETVAVCPSTAGFGGAAVHVTAALGARVIAMGRNEEELKRLKNFIDKGMPWAHVETVKITGDQAADTATLKAFGPLDAILDISPPEAAQSANLLSATHALRRGGRISIMGNVGQNLMDGFNFIGSDIVAKGKLMYDREDLLLFVKMLEVGLFGKGTNFVERRAFALEDWDRAFDEAATYAGIGRIVTFSL
ncbi:GroES-like protein [Xylariaceae sp. FL0255]|nr:GroES-like protein [Xylariaceae sp. FL0255]